MVVVVFEVVVELAVFVLLRLQWHPCVEKWYFQRSRKRV